MASALSISNRLRTPPRRHATVLSRNTLDSPSSDSSGVVCPSLNTSSTTANQPESSLSKGHPRRIPSQERQGSSERSSVPAAISDQENDPPESRWARRSQRVKEALIRKKVREVGPVPVEGNLVFRDSTSSVNLRHEMDSIQQTIQEDDLRPASPASITTLATAV